LQKKIEEMMFRSLPLNKKACDNILIRKNEEKLFNGHDIRIEENKIERSFLLLICSINYLYILNLVFNIFFEGHFPFES
jgi:hypothetical protein